MAFWLVYQGDSFDRSRAGGYLWAPKLGRGEYPKTQEYWQNMTRVRPGDIIFSGLNNALRAVSMAGSAAYDADWPDARDEKNWGREGWRLDLTFFDLPEPLFYADWVPSVFEQLRYKHSPFDKRGGPVQGFLFSLPNAVGEMLVEMADQPGLDVGLAALEQAKPGEQETEKEAIAKARIGQGKFRDSLISAWQGRCPLSGVDRPELLRASHIKPWASCNNAERLDPSNGLLLSAAYDAAFDAKLITFDAAGKIILAVGFTPAQASAAGIDIGATISGLTGAHHQYLGAHREIFDAKLNPKQTGDGH